MATDLTLTLPNEPGQLAAVSEALGGAGINIEGGCGFPCDDVGIVHLLVEDPAAARQALDAAGIEINLEREVLVIDVEDRPGELGQLARRLADAGLNIDVMYLATRTRVVVGVNDPDRARAVLS